MAKSNHSLHQPQDKSRTALLVMDMISTWRFPQAKSLLAAALAVTPVVGRLKARFKASGLPVIYANDNAGRWRSDWRQLMDEALAAGGKGARIAQLLCPDSDDYFVLKPMHSAFFATPLLLLLQHLEVRHLVICGVTSDQCVLATAVAARMHQYRVSVPRDAVATMTPARSDAALRYFQDVLQLSTTPASRLRWQ